MYLCFWQCLSFMVNYKCVENAYFHLCNLPNFNLNRIYELFSYQGGQYWMDTFSQCCKFGYTNLANESYEHFQYSPWRTSITSFQALNEFYYVNCQVWTFKPNPPFVCINNPFGRYLYIHLKNWFVISYFEKIIFDCMPP